MSIDSIHCASMNYMGSKHNLMQRDKWQRPLKILEVTRKSMSRLILLSLLIIWKLDYDLFNHLTNAYCMYQILLAAAEKIGMIQIKLFP